LRRALREVAAGMRQGLEQADDLGLHGRILAPNVLSAARVQQRFRKYLTSAAKPE
jgi:hypothetical protein